MSFYRGGLVQVEGAFTDSNNAALDPTAVLITVIRPDGRSNTYTYGTDTSVVKDSTGNYHVNLSADVAGIWRYWWHSTGTGQAADERTFTVEEAISASPPGQPQSLQLDYTRITREIGRLLGWSRDSHGWSDRERQDAGDIIRSGLSRFYWAPILPGANGQGATVHSWSFLRAVGTITLVAGQSAYNLPEDFGELIEGGFTPSAGSGVSSIGLIGEEQVRQLQAASNTSSTPKYAAIQRLPGAPAKYQVLFYPTPSDALSLTHNYSIAPPDLTEVSPYPYGGPQHADTILEAILAAAEQKLQDAAGIHEQRFQECLARSIAADQNLKAQSDESPWPIESASGVGLATGLGVTKSYLKRMIGRLLEFGPNPALWTHRQSEEVNTVLDTGLRKFYSPMVLPGERYGYEWSFLKPVYTLPLVADVNTYDLPEDFAFTDGPLTHAPTAAALYPSIPIVGENQIRYRQQQSTASGRPCYAATRAKNPTPSGVTRWEMLFWPTPDSSYDVTFRYQTNASTMPDDACLPHGGPPHAQTVIEACLSAAEQHRGTKDGTHSQLFLENLIRSVSHDRKANSPSSLGPNRDGSDLVYDRNYHLLNENINSYNGILY